MTSAMMKAISESSEKRTRCFRSQRKGVFLVTLHSEIWGETAEKPGRIMDTQAFIGDDYTGLPTRVRSVVLCHGVLQNCVLQSSLDFVYLKSPWGLIQFLPVSEADYKKLDRQSKKREIIRFFPVNNCIGQCLKDIL